jgi:transmembrane sensor
MNKEEIVSLLHKSINGGALTETERNNLENWISSSEHNRKLYEEIMNAESFRQEIKQTLDYNSSGLWEKINYQLQPPKQQNKFIFIFRNRTLRYAAAAVLVFLISTTAYFMFIKPGAEPLPISGKQHPPSIRDVAPGTEKAVLTLADGTTIALDSLASGAVAKQGNTVIVKEDGLLAYNTDTKNLSIEILYNTLTVPRGGEYKSLVLADGTKVWMNAESSIRFPVAFIKSEREVEIMGEAYFEVAHNKEQPFKVSVNGMKVEVVGTHFNVNAYSDEAVIKTTLLEGSIKVVTGKSVALIKPGQQAQVPNTDSGDESIKVVNEADVNAAVAWKNGLLVFNQADIKTILRQVARWYDVSIEYKGDIKVPKSYGEIPRNVTLSEVLKIIGINSKLQFSIEGKKVTVKQS